MAADFFLGESLLGDGNEVAHIDLLIGAKGYVVAIDASLKDGTRPNAILLLPELRRQRPHQSIDGQVEVEARQELRPRGPRHRDRLLLGVGGTGGGEKKERREGGRNQWSAGGGHAASFSSSSAMRCSSSSTRFFNAGSWRNTTDAFRQSV